jgi:hypothetical protein
VITMAKDEFREKLYRWLGIPAQLMIEDERD